MTHEERQKIVTIEDVVEILRNYNLIARHGMVFPCDDPYPHGFHTGSIP